jgi:hypothetical protein
MRYQTLALVSVLFCVAPFCGKADTLYTSSAAFLAALGTDVQTEDFSNSAIFFDGEDIPDGFSADGITYGPFTLTDGATDLITTGLFNSISGLGLGVDHTVLGSLYTFFFGGEGATLTFARPVTAVGLFFNVSTGTGSYAVTANGATASTGSTTYDENTFVFAGIISTTPFTTASFDSTNLLIGSYTVPEIVTSLITPEPTAFLPLGAGLALLPLLRRRFRA